MLGPVARLRPQRTLPTPVASYSKTTRWSPNGTQLALDAPTGGMAATSFALDLASGERKLLLARAAFCLVSRWEADLLHAVLSRRRLDVFVIDVDGSRARRLTQAPGEDTASLVARRIVVTSERTGHEQVLVMKADGSNQRNISRARSNDVATDCT